MMGIQWIYTLYTTQIHVAKMKQSVFYKTSLDLTLRYKIDVWKYFDKINTMNVQSELQVKRWTICAQSQCCQIYQNIDSEYLMLCKYSFSAVSIHQYKRQRQLTHRHTQQCYVYIQRYISKLSVCILDVKHMFWVHFLPHETFAKLIFHYHHYAEHKE